MRTRRIQAPGRPITGLLGGFALICLPGPAPAQDATSGASSWYAAGAGVDWSLESRVSHQITGDINRDLDPGSDAVLLTNALEAGLVLDAETKRALFSVELGLTASHFLGEDPELDGEVRLDPSVDLNGAWRGKTSMITVALGFDVTQAAIAGSDDAGAVPGDISQFTVTYSTELEQQLDSRNTLTLGSFGTVIDFSETSTDLIPSRTFGLEAGWQRLLTETTSMTLEAGIRQFTADDLVNTRSHTLDLTAGLSHRRTSRHTFSGSLGVTTVRTTATRAGTDFDVGVIGGAAFEYATNDTIAGIDFAQTIEPSTAGSLQSFSRLDGNLSYEINTHEQLELLAAYSRRTPLGGGGDTLDFFSLGTNYVLALTDSADLTLGYLFQGNNDSVTGAAFGHQVFVSVGNSFVLVP